MARRNARKLLVNTVTKTWSLVLQKRGATDMKWLGKNVNSAELHYELCMPLSNAGSPNVQPTYISCTTVTDTQELLLVLKYSDAILTNVSTEDMRSGEYPVVYTSTQ